MHARTHATSARTHARTYGHVRARARSDLEEAKGEEREDVDSPPSDRDRVVRRDAASCCRSTVSGSLGFVLSTMDRIGRADDCTGEIVLRVVVIVVPRRRARQHDYAVEESDA